jgi:hypothetical protein
MECGIYDNPRVGTRFRHHNYVVLRCTIVRYTIGEQLRRGRDERRTRIRVRGKTMRE